MDPVEEVIQQKILRHDEDLSCREWKWEEGNPNNMVTGAAEYSQLGRAPFSQTTQPLTKTNDVLTRTQFDCKLQPFLIHFSHGTWNTTQTSQL